MALTDLGRVYFIRCPANGFIKIGYTAGDPSERLWRLRATIPVPIEPLAWVEGTIADERRLHERFAEAWSHGEWFRPVPDLVKFIEAVGTPWTPWPRRMLKRRRLVAPPPEKPSVAEWAEATTLTHRGQTQTVAEWSRITGTSAFAIKCRLARGYDPDSEFLLWSPGSPRNPSRLRPRAVRK